MKYLLPILVLISFLGAAPKPTAEHIAHIEEFMYESALEAFQPKRFYSTVNTSYTAPWEKKNPYSKKQLKAALKTLDKKATVKVEKAFFGKKRILFESEFPKNITDIRDYFSLELTKSKIKNSKKQKVGFSKTGMVMYGARNKSGSKNGKSYSNEWVTVSGKFDSDDKPGEKHKGKVTFTAKFISGYHKVSITPKDIGKSFKMGKVKFKVIDVVGNRVVLDTKGKSIEGIDYVNINAKGKEIVAMSYSDFEKTGDTSIRYGDIPSAGYQTMDIEIYKSFIKNPGMTLDDFRKSFHQKFTSGKPSNPKNYLILVSADAIQTMVLHKPKYGVKKKISKKIK